MTDVKEMKKRKNEQKLTEFVTTYEEGEAEKRFDLKRLRKVTVVKNAQGMEIQEIIELMNKLGLNWAKLSSS